MNAPGRRRFSPTSAATCRPTPTPGTTRCTAPAGSSRSPAGRTPAAASSRRSRPTRAAAPVLALIQQLYEVERDVADADARGAPRRRGRRRPRRCSRHLDQVRQELTPRVLPKSPLGEALRYLDHQWGALQRYLTTASLLIDNNNAERQLRAVAVGRKNWLFAGSFEGARRAALLYSLIQSCRLVDVSPFLYLRDVLVRVATHPHQRLHELTPRGWKATFGDIFPKGDTMSVMATDAKGRRLRRVFTDEFKAGAVRLVLDEGKTVGQVARDLDLTETALREWVNRARADRTHGRTGLTTAEREELARLRKENRQLRVEHEILKRVHAYTGSRSSF